MTISLRGVTKSYPEAGRLRLILDALNLDVGEGEFLAITGPSGSGKSSLLNIIGAIDRADQGVVQVASRELGALSEHERALFRRRHIGFVFQFFNLIPTLTVRENLELPIMLARNQAAGETADEWLAKLELTSRADAYPDVLSGGEQQRVAILRAAIHRPTVILADEPTGNLDRSAGERVLTLLDSLAQSGTTVIMATHSSAAASAASRHLVLQQGRLSDAGPGTETSGNVE